MSFRLTNFLRFSSNNAPPTSDMTVPQPNAISISDFKHVGSCLTIYDLQDLASIRYLLRRNSRDDIRLWRTVEEEKESLSFCQDPHYAKELYKYAQLMEYCYFVSLMNHFTLSFIFI